MSYRIPIEIPNADGVSSPANIVIGLSKQEISNADTLWRACTEQYQREGHLKGVILTPAQHSHWDWINKSHYYPEQSFLGIEAAEVMQGLMIWKTAECRLPVSLGKELLYIDFLATAPWNYMPLVQAFQRKPTYRGVGSTLMEFAIRWSKAMQMDGRIGLHSLKQAESFYKMVFHMVDLGKDSHKEKPALF